MFEMIRAAWAELMTADNSSLPFRPFNWTMLLCAFASVIVIAIFELNGSKYYDGYRGWYFLAPITFLMLALNGPVMRVAQNRRERAIHVVLLWGLIGIVSFIATFVAAFSAFVPASNSTAGVTYDRLLNIIPAVIAVWIAGLGWYAQHQIAMKAHRTTHAFNLIMQTRTNTEYLRNLRAFQLVYPPGISISIDDERWFDKTAVSRLPDIERVRDNPSASEEQRADAIKNINKVEAAVAAKYLLNYYEFMARGIHSGDLDSQILYDTIGSTVVDIYRRTQSLTKLYKRSQPLAMQFLTPLVETWDKQKRKDSGAAAVG